MALSAFDNKSRPPTDEELSKTLGATFRLWSNLQKQIIAALPGVFAAWGFTSKSTGWGLRLKTEKRVIVYMTPRDKCFLVSFALGEKAATAAHNSDLPGEVLETIDKAPKYAEGRGVRFEVKNAKQVSWIAKLARLKMEN